MSGEDAVEVGIGLLRSEAVAEQARRAETLGFDSVHCGEHVFFYGPTPNALIALSVAAGATSRLKLLSAITLLPLYPAALVAKMASVLDVASGGRFRLGIGVGGEYPREFAAVGVPLAERGRRTDEGLEIVSRLFAGEEVTFSGRWAKLDRVRLAPAPLTPGGPEVWIAGRRDAAQRRAGRYGHVWMPYMCTPEQLASGLAVARQAASDAGRPPPRGAVHTFIVTDRDRDRARRIARDTVGRIYQQDFSRLMHYLVAGTPEECVSRLREYRAAGATALMLNPAVDEADPGRMIELLASEVLPALRP